MKTLITFVALFAVIAANAQTDMSSYITKTSYNKTYTQWHSPDYYTTNGSILFSFSKTASTTYLTKQINLELGFCGPMASSNVTDVTIRFDDGDQLSFHNIPLSFTHEEGTPLYRNVVSVELNGAELYRLKTKKVVGFAVAQRYCDDLPPTFQTNTMAFAACIESAM